MSSFCTEQILLLAGSIYTGIGAPSAQSVGYVSGWLTSSGGMLGDLNNRLGTSFYLSGAGPCIAGGFTPEEGAIAAMIYDMSYSFGQARAALANGGSMWTSIAEGDTKINRASAVEVSKAYRGMATDAETTLNGMIHDWKLNHSLATTVNAESLASWPSPS